MNITKNIILWCLLVLSSLTLCGCGSLTLCDCDKKADENEPIGEVKAEAEKMSVKKLRSMAMTYKEDIMAQKGEVEKLVAARGVCKARRKAS